MNPKLALLLVGFSLLVIWSLFILLREQSVEIEIIKNQNPKAFTENQEKVIVVIDITSEAASAEINELADKLRELQNTERVTAFSTTDTLVNFRDAYRSNNEAIREIEMLESNPFPARIKLEVKNEVNISELQLQLINLDTNNIISSTAVGNDAMYEF